MDRRVAPTEAPPLEQRAAGAWRPSAAKWVLFFLLWEMVCQLALLPPFMTTIRTGLRAAPFVASLAMLFVLARRAARPQHPAVLWTFLILGFVSLGVAHPERNSMPARIATIAMYAGIIAPVIWVVTDDLDQRWLRWLILAFWAFNSLSAMMGVAQTQRPDLLWLQPNLSSVVQASNDAGEGLKITLANGTQVFRPMGLSDLPGGAAMAGLATVVFGATIVTFTRRFWVGAACLALMMMGMFCILLSQVRSVLIMTAVCCLTLGMVLWRRGDYAKMVRALLMLTVMAVVASTWAVVVGGDTVVNRLATLVEEDPSSVYYKNRGRFLDYTVHEVIPKYPMGAGLGRWGMMNHYFGTQDDPRSEPLWAEIIWTGWAYDGGVPLMLLYTIALIITMRIAYKIAVDRSNGELGVWAGVIFAYDVGCLACTFNYPFFMSQSGLDFWLLNAALYAAARYEYSQRAKRGSPSLSPDASHDAPAPTSLLGMHS